MRRLSCTLGLCLSLVPGLSAQTYRALYEHDTGEQPVAIRNLADRTTAVLNWLNQEVTIHTSVMRVDRFGESLWHHFWTATEFDFPTDMIETASGDLVIVGLAESNPWIHRIRADDGSTVWSRKLERSGQFNSVAEDSNGNLVAVGTDWTSGDALVADFDAAGSLLQTSLYGLPGINEVAFDIEAADDGAVAIVGQTREHDLSGFGNLWAFQLNASRNLVWSTVVGDPDDTIGHNAHIARLSDGLGYAISSEFNTGGIVDGNLFAAFLNESGEFQEALKASPSTIRDLRATDHGSVWLIGDSGSIDDRFGFFIEWKPAPASLENGGIIDSMSEYFVFGMDLTEYGGLVAAASQPHSAKQGHTSMELVRLNPDANFECIPVIFCPNAETISVDSEESTSTRTLLAGVTASELPVIRGNLQASRTADCENCVVNSADIGPGTIGHDGWTPNLALNQGSCDGSVPRELTISGGLGGAFSLLLLNTEPVDLPFANGSLYVNPAGWIIVPFVLPGSGGGQGSLTISDSTNLTSAIGLPLYLQLMVADPSAAKNVALSNGLRMVVGN